RCRGRSSRAARARRSCPSARTSRSRGRSSWSRRPPRGDYGASVGSREMQRVYLSPPHLSGRELHYLRDAIDSHSVPPLGPHVDAFGAEISELAGVPHALALASGTAALHLALVVLGIGPGDEVACSSLTFSASANPIRFVGATPVFLDATAETWTL